MKFGLKILFIATTAFLMQWYLPWWSVVLASFVISLILSSNGVSSFFAGFLGIGLLWFMHALIIDIGTDSIISSKASEILFLPNSFLLVLITGLVGALCGGLGALAGSHTRSLFFKERKYRSKYRAGY